VDEALAVGDAAFQFKCLDRLRTLTSNGTTLLFVSHDMGMVKNFCHHALYLYKGQKRALGAPEELAELYFLDMRDEQRQWATGNQRVQIKSFRGEGPGIAFGTEEGEITSACFTNTGGLSSSFFKGEEIEVSIKLRFRGSLKNPHLSVSIEDRRMMSVGGKYFPVSGTQDADGWFWGAITVKFPAILGEGNYHITARLEDRSGREFFPVDKQVGLLSFEVIDADQTVLGAVDFDMRAV